MYNICDSLSLRYLSISYQKFTLNKRNIQEFYERTGQKWGQCWSRTNLNGFADHYLTVRTITQIYDEENEIEKYTNFVGIEPTTSCLQNVRSTNKLKIRCNSFSDYHHIARQVGFEPTKNSFGDCPLNHSSTDAN